MSEVRLLKRAQRSLELDPAGALGLLELHAASFPGGTFEQEREGLRVDALRQLGRLREARREAAWFLQRFPRSPQRLRMQRLLENAAGDHKNAVPQAPTEHNQEVLP